MQLMGWVWLFAAGAGWLLMRRAKVCRPLARRLLKIVAAVAALPLNAATSWAQAPEASGEASLKLPDLSQVTFFGIDGHKLLLFGILFCVFGLIFGLTIYQRLKNLPVHRSMREISELIYETCKTYLITQGKFILVLEIFIGLIMLLYFGVLQRMERCTGRFFSR
jgi:K(+)-stimulated pyrophosphate-energized sodium pump